MYLSLQDEFGVEVCTLSAPVDLSHLGNFRVFLGNYAQYVGTTYALDVTVTHLRMGYVRNAPIAYATSMATNGTVVSAALDPAAYPINAGRYAMHVPAGLVVDKSGTWSQGLPATAPDAWTFKAATVPKPLTLLATTPPHNLGVVQRGLTELVLQFNTALVVGSGAVSVLSEAGDTLFTRDVSEAGAVAVSCSAATIAIPSHVFDAYDTKYQVTVASGAFVSVSGSAAGNQAVEVGDWVFTTAADTQGPMLVSTCVLSCATSPPPSFARHVHMQLTMCFRVMRCFQVPRGW